MFQIYADFLHSQNLEPLKKPGSQAQGVAIAYSNLLVTELMHYVSVILRCRRKCCSLMLKRGAF